MAGLTKSFVDSRPTPESGYQAHWDQKVPGFGLRITSTGRKTFIAQGRLRGRNLTITIGQLGVFTVEEAREEAREILRDLRRGDDPREKRQRAKATGITLREVANEYMARPGKLKASTKEHIDRHVKTTFADKENRPVIEIDEDYCRSRYRKMLKHGLRGNRKNGSPGQANQAFQTLKALINYGIRQHDLPFKRNPVIALADDWVTLKERDSYIKASRVGFVWNFLVNERDRAYTHADLSGIEVAMFQILAGCRFGEASQLQWTNVNLEEAWWHLPDPKNRRPIWLPLSKQAVDLLEQRPRVRGNDHVFPGKVRGTHIKDPRSVWERISKIAGEKIRSHDARRTLITNGVAECGIDFYKLELLTGHVLQGVTAKHYLDTKRLQYLLPELQKYADWIETKAEQAAGSNIIPIRA